MTDGIGVMSDGMSRSLSRQLLREERQAEALRQDARGRRRFVAGPGSPCGGCGASACNMVVEKLGDEFGDRERRCRLCSGVDYLGEVV